MDGVYRLSIAILGDEADARDAAQDTFLTAWRQSEPCVIRTSSTRGCSVWRSMRRGWRIDRGDVVAFARSPRAGSARRRPFRAVGRPGTTDGRVLDAALRTLDVDQRSILVLHHLEGRSIVELAAILDIPTGTVKSRLHAARRALQAAIDAEASDR